MEYLELNIITPDATTAEILTALLADFPFEAFEEDDFHLKAYIPCSEYDACRCEVEQILSQQGITDFTATPIKQQNWNAEWEECFEPVEVDGEHPILIRASHHTAAPGVIDVVIAPRMSFGTGHHATTALMSQCIAKMDLRHRRGLDMGCGTGVLAIVAIKCGAERMVAVDIDDWACDSCRDSIALSGVAEQIEVRCGSMDAVKGEKFDFLVANINRNILTAMMPSFEAALDKDGLLLMSGFLSEDLPHIETSATEYGFEMVATAERDGWMVAEYKKIR